MNWRLILQVRLVFLDFSFLSNFSSFYYPFPRSSCLYSLSINFYVTQWVYVRLLHDELQ